MKSKKKPFNLCLSKLGHISQLDASHVIFLLNFSYQTDYDVMTCVACHPRDLCIATGCKDGKIIIW